MSIAEFNDSVLERVVDGDIDRFLTSAVFAIHGPIDAALTVFTVVSLKSTVVETNPYLSRLMTEAFHWSLSSSTPSLAVAIGAVGVAKIVAVGVAVGLLSYGRDIIPYWRAFAAFLFLSGIVIVAGNIVKLVHIGL